MHFSCFCLRGCRCRVLCRCGLDGLVSKSEVVDESGLTVDIGMRDDEREGESDCQVFMGLVQSSMSIDGGQLT